jgi:hypothetical protein
MNYKKSGFFYKEAALEKLFMLKKLISSDRIAIVTGDPDV